jgi:hypothetical protein
LLESIEALYPLLICIHVFLDNARYHHAKLVQEWLSRPGCRIRLHFLPAPHGELWVNGFSFGHVSNSDGSFGIRGPSPIA